MGTEFVGTSMSSGGDGVPRTAYDPDPANPHVRFQNSGNRGYVRIVADHGSLLADYRVVDTVLQPTSDVRTLASFVVEAGRPGLQLP